MEDSAIVSLYWARDERALRASEEKYGNYCRTIARRILGDPEDADECVNDTWLGAWSSIPPHRPAVLSAFLGKLTRRISLNRWRDRTRDKRGGGELPLALDELAECIPAPRDNVERVVELMELARAIDPRLTIHDLQAAAGKSRTRVSFDLLVPYHFPMGDDQIRIALEEGVRALSERYVPIVQVDHPYVDGE